MPTHNNTTTPRRYNDTLTPEQHSTLGVIIGVLLVILVFILSGLYLWGASIDQTAGYQQKTSTTIGR